MTNAPFPTPAEAEAMRRFREDRIDPMTGKPWVLCGNNVSRIHAENRCACGGCGRTVTLDADGLWIYES